MRCLLVRLIFTGVALAGGVAGVQKTAYAPPVIRDLGVRNVRLEMYGWEESDRKMTPSPGLFAGDGSMQDQLISGRYQMALAGRWPAGSREVFGFIGGPYPNESSFTVARFTRSDSNIDIILRRSEAGGKGDGYRSWKIAYLSATLPVDLPDGKYSVQVSVQDEKGEPDAMTRRPAQCDVLNPNPAEIEAKSAREDLKKLNEEELLRAYLDAGRALGNSPLAPREVPVPDLPPYAFNDVKYVRFRDIGNEIVRRKEAIVPWLMAALEHQAPLSARSQGQYPFGFARALMDLIVRIDDPRPAALLADVVDGLDGKVILPVRQAALDSLEKLTSITFRRQTLTDGRTRWAVEDPEATPVDSRDPIFGPRGPNGQATAFRAWLGRDGKDPTQWPKLAQARAREALHGRDLRAIYAAVDFLQNGDPSHSRDDDPAATMQVIGDLLEQAKQVGFRAGNYDYQIDGRLLPMTIVDWSSKLACYGVRARPWAQTLVRIDQEIALPSGKRMANLNAIGGEAVVEYLVERIPELERRLADANVDLHANPDELTEERQQQLLSAAQIGRWALSRWTGRVFDNDQQIGNWWKENQSKSQGSWLRESLELTAGRADRGDIESQHLLRVLLPDSPERSRVQWVRDNQVYFAYDEQNGCFHLDRNAFP